MSQTKPTITAQMIVKNEDQWAWFAIRSVLEYVDHLIIYDTGSTDRTVDVLKTIVHTKISFEQHKVQNPEEFAKLRQRQLDQTQTDWLWLLDGDEIYPQRTCQEIVKLIRQQPHLEGVILKRFDLLGDVYHYQPDPTVGGYQLWDQLGHFNLRLINRRIPGLSLAGAYPNESYVDGNNQPIISHPKANFAFTQNGYWHTTYLKRSSLGSNLKATLHRQKYKVEWGRAFAKNQPMPEAFWLSDRPPLVPDPMIKRSVLYNLKAVVVTPLKMLKRKLH